MPRHGRLTLILLACLFALVAPAAEADAACTINWATDAGGAWSNAANWSPARVPLSNDDVCIDRGAANPTITVASGSQVARELTSAERLEITGGTLTVGAASAISGPLDLTGGAFNVDNAVTLAGTTTLGAASVGGSGSGSIVNTGTFLVPGDATLTQTARNEGTFRVTTGTLTLNRTLTNAATLELQGDGDIAGFNLVNDGTIRKTAGTGISQLGHTTSCCANLNGTAAAFEAQTGTLELAGNLNLTGGATLDASSGATVRTRPPTGTNETTLSFSGILSAPGAGTVDLSRTRVTNLGTALPATITGTLRATTGGFFGTGGAGRVVSQATITLAADSWVSEWFTNEGTIVQAGNASFGGTTAVNTGLWDIQGDYALTRTTNAQLFNNGGTIRKSAGTGTAVLDRIHGAHPTFDVRAGTLQLSEQSTWTGGAVLNAATGAIFRFQRGSECCWLVDVSGTVTGSGAGRVENVNAELRGGTLDFPAGYFHSTGSLTSLTNTGEITMAGGAIANATNSGTIRQTANAGYGGTITHTGTWDIQGDYSLTRSGNATLFNNGGTIRKSAGSGIAQLDRVFGAHPTFDVQAGTLQLSEQSTWTDGAILNAAANAIFRFQRGSECCWAMDVSGTLTGSGAGRVELVNGNLRAGAQPLTLNFPAGYFHSTGTLYWLTNTGEITLAGGQLHDLFTNTGTIRQTGDVGWDGGLINTGTWDIRGDHALTRTANARFQNNGGVIRKSAGTGTASLNGNFDGAHPRFDVQAGVLQLTDSSTWTAGAQIDAAAGAVFRFQRANECCWTMDVSGTLTGTGAGRVEHVNGNLRAGAQPLTLDFPAGYFRSTGGQLYWLTNTGEITLAGTQLQDLFTNTGTIRQTGNVGWNGGILNTGTWDLHGDHALTQNANGRFQNNNGVIRKSTGTGTAALTGQFDGAHPRFDVQAGVLQLANQSVWTDGAQIDAAAGAIFRFRRADECCWTMQASGTLTGSGEGLVEHVNGNLTAGAQPLTLNFPAGYFRSTGQLYGLTNTGEITLAGNQLHSGFTNTGTIRQTADTRWNGGILNTGTWDIEGDHALTQNANGRFQNNDGLIRKSAGAGTATLTGQFDGAHPRFDVAAGTLQLSDNSTWTQGAQIDAATGATFRMFKENSCCFTVRASGTLTGTGGGRFVIDSGDFGGGSTVNFAPGYFHVRGGTLRDTINAGTLALTGAHVTSGFVNQGTVEQSGDSAGGYSGSVVNDGTWLLTGDSGLIPTANNSWRNNGTVRRTGGTTVATIRGSFDNRGTVEARSGALAIEESTQFSSLRNINGGHWVVADGAVMTFPTFFGIENNAGDITISGSGSIPELSGPQTSLRRNTGTITLNQGATVNLPASLTNAGILNLGRSARLNVNAGFTQEATGTLATTIDGRPVSGAYGVLDAEGAATLNGTLAVSTGSGFSAVNGDSYSVVRSLSRSGQFAQYTGLPISAAVAFKPDTREDGVNLRVATLGDTRSALRVTTVNVTPATTLFGGVDATVDYTVANDGDPTTAGTWTDSIYLSTDGAYDPSDALVARVTHTGNVGRDGTYSGSFTGAVPGVVPGEYRFVVVPDSRGANAAAAPGEGARASVARTVDVQELPLSTPVNATVLTNRTRYYRVPAGTTPLQIDAAFGVSGRARVLARTGAIPDVGSYEQGSDGEATPRLLMASPNGQPIYVAVVGLTGGNFTLTAGAVQFGLSEITPARANATGQTTITIVGAGFTDAAQVQLVGPGTRDATKVSVTGQQVLHATFSLAGATPGLYGVKVTDGARSATLPNAFTVNASQEPGKLVVSSQAPSTFRINYGGFYSVTMHNTGGSDVLMPLVRVTATKATAWAITSTGPSGLTSTAFYNTRQPAVIPPGGSVSIPIRFQDSGVSAHEIVRFKTQLILPDDTPMDWSSRKAGLRPAGITPASWDKIWPAFLTIVGPTKKTYMAALNDAAARAAASGRTLAGEGEMLLALRERAIARAPGAPLRGTLTIAGQPGAGKTLTAFDDDGRGGTVRTDDDGGFSIWDIPAGTYTLTLRDREPWGTVTVPSGSVSMALPGATQIAGVARDVRGKPVANARVEGRDGRRLYLATTDKQGRFMLDEVVAGTVRVSVRPVNAAAPAPQDVTVNGAAPPASLTFTIGQGAVVQGTIKRADGSAAAGATVSVGSEKTVTDAAGNYLVDSLDGGTYVVAASAENAGAVSKVVTVPDNGAGTADLTLDAEARVTGTITASGGQPLAGATVILLDRGARHDPIITGAGGTYTLRGLSRGEHQLLFTAAGYGTAARKVELDPGAQATLSVTLAPKGRITGLAAPGANVYLRGDAHPPAAVTANGNGEFAFEDLPAGSYALGLDPALTVTRRVVEVDGVESVDLRTSTVTLSGSTRDAAGAAVGGVGVILLRGTDEVARGASGANGAYSFRIAAAGTYSVRADRVGYGIGTSAAVTVGASNVTGVNVTPGTATLSVRVRNAAGTLTAGAEVVAGSQRAETGADGIARFPGLPAGSYAVSAAGVSEVASGLTATLAAGGTTFDVQTAAPATLTGTVRDANGQPVAGAHVLATNATGSTAMAFTGADGTYSFTRLNAGAYEVSYADGKRRATTRSLIIPATLDVNLATVATPLSVVTDGAARGLLEIKRGALYVPVLLRSADDLTGKLGLGGLEGSAEYRLTLAADGRPQVTTTFTTDPTGAPSGLPASVSLAALAALPADIYASAPARKAAKSAAAAPDLPPMYQDFAETIFKAFDRAGGQLNGPKKIDFDTELWRLSWVFFVEDSCDPDLEADLKAAENASNAIEKAFRDWQIVAEQGSEDRAGDMAKLAAAATQMAAQVTLVLSGIGSMQIAFASVEAGAFTAGQRAFLDVAGNLAQSLNTAVNDLRSGNGLVGGWSSFVDHITGFMGSMATAAAQDPTLLSDFTWQTSMGGASSALGLLDTIKTAMWDLQNQRDAVDDNVAMTLADYLIAQQKYLDAVKKYKATLDRLKHYQAPAGQECPDPPPPVPVVTVDQTDDNPGIEGLLPDDPNEIVGPAGAGPGHWLREGDGLEYTIHFENKATATLPARKVIITHVLDADADLSTFELGSAGFNRHLVTAPAKRQSWRTTIDDTEDSGTVVEVDARLNASTRTATWTFTALDEATGDEPADPLKGFLPAAIHPPDGGGFATYRVKSLSGARIVDAQARIVFDANAPIDTNVYRNGFDVAPPSSSVTALPATTTAASFPVAWSGSDAGSGVASYDVYVAVDGGAFARWQTATSATSATYPGTAGHRYAFYSVATDAVGFVEAAAGTAQAQTSVVAPQVIGPPLPAPPVVQPPVAAPFKPVLTVVRKGTGKYEIRIKNGGAKADRFKLKLAKRKGYTLKVMAGKKDVTKLVVKGTYRTASVAPGKTLTLKLTIKGKRKASFTLTATSIGDAKARSNATAKFPK